MKKTILTLVLFSVLLSGCGKEPTESTPAASVTGWGFRRMEGARPEFTAAQIKEMETNECIYMGKDDKSLYLTFDEGYENGYTASILDTLKEKNVPAAFFITTPYLEKETELVRRMVEEGHVVGNHTARHPSLPTLSEDSAVRAELTDLADAFYEKFGQKMTFFRPPKGEYNARTLKIVKDMGYTNVFWSFAYMDWDVEAQKGADYAYEKVTEGLHGGAVLLLHAVSADNAAALGRIIDTARQAGYTFKSLHEYQSM